MADHKAAKEDAKYMAECRGNQQIINLAICYLEQAAQLERLLELASPFAALKLTESEIEQDAHYASGRPIFAKDGALITVRDILGLRKELEQK